MLSRAMGYQPVCSRKKGGYEFVGPGRGLAALAQNFSAGLGAQVGYRWV